MSLTWLTVKSNSKNFDLIFEYSSGAGDFDCCDVCVTVSSLPRTIENAVSFVTVESQTV